MAFLPPSGQVRPSVKEVLRLSGLVSAAQRESPQDAWQGLWKELQLGK